MFNSWDKTYRMYSWTVDLSHFGKTADYPGYFNRVITPADIVTFENKFRTAIDDIGSFEIAGEVCFWKNYGNAHARNRVTQKLLAHLRDPVNWNRFVRAVKQVSSDPSYDNFVTLRDACYQPRGFATPITFLAFYKPTEYPMVDKHIANWWAVNRAKYGYEASPKFSQRNDGWIQTYTISQNKQNWNAYVAWRRFCRDYAIRMANNCGLNWRVRDVEMAVWEAQKNDISLEVLPQTHERATSHNSG